MKTGRDLLKSAVSLLAGDYAPYRIFSWDLTADPPVLPVEPGLELRVVEDQGEALQLSAFVDGQRASTCFTWFGDRYRRERNFWPLGPREAKLVHIETDPAFRGRGLAVRLLMFAGVEMKVRGFERLYARIWHNNTPSLKAFQKAGWRYEHFVLELAPSMLGRRLRLMSTRR